MSIKLSFLVLPASQISKKNIIVTVLRKRKDILSSVMKTVVCNLVIS